MAAARSVADALQNNVMQEVECIGEYLNLQPLLQTSGGAAYLFRSVRGYPVPSCVQMTPMTRDFVATIKRFVD